MLSSLEVVGTSPVFKCLEISQCTSLYSVVVRESNVVCIKYAGPRIQHARFKLVGVPRLTQLWIQAEQEQAMLHYIMNIRNIIDMFDSVLPQLHTLKIYSKYKITRDDALQKMMPNLKELVVASHREKTEAEKKAMEALGMNYLFNGSDYEVLKINSKSEVQWAYSHIKEVEFVVYRGVCNHLQMITQLVLHGVALEKTIVDPRSFEHRDNMPWDRISRNQMKDEIIARERAKNQLKHVTSRININIL
ncbi:F-box/LRR-repeat protein [Salvia divinorum]|uniref:F-box/LRR-repeat protein n=1 Tax=Salvia divinorum TaxID=28513 RepID=A0ABD1FQ17_SALDI